MNTMISNFFQKKSVRLSLLLALLMLAFVPAAQIQAQSPEPGSVDTHSAPGTANEPLPPLHSEPEPTANVQTPDVDNEAAPAPVTRPAVPLNAYLTLAAALFIIGTIGVVIKRNPIVLFMCIEMMLNAVNLTFVAFARYHQGNQVVDATTAQVGGQMNVVFVMAVAAAEVAVGLGIIMAIFRLRENINIDEMNLLRG